MKRYVTLLAILLCTVLLLLPCTAAPAPRLIDGAGLLNESEYASLLYKLDEISVRQGCDVVICTLPSLNGTDAVVYADDFYDRTGFGQGADHSGILLLISMAEREWVISTCGQAIPIFTDYRQTQISNAILDDLSSGDYYGAFSTFAEECDWYITQGPPTGDEDDFTYFDCLMVGLLVGVIAAFLYTAVLKGQLKSVRPAQNAANYTREGSFQLTESNDVFLYRNVHRRLREQNSSSGGSTVHRSSSGRVHGGSRGRF